MRDLLIFQGRPTRSLSRYASQLTLIFLMFVLNVWPAVLKLHVVGLGNEISSSVKVVVKNSFKVLAEPCAKIAFKIIKYRPFLFSIPHFWVKLALYKILLLLCSLLSMTLLDSFRFSELFNLIYIYITLFYSFFIKLLVQAMKESYRQEQKRRIKELSSALKDPSVIILSSWLKVKDNTCQH